MSLSRKTIDSKKQVSSSFFNFVTTCAFVTVSILSGCRPDSSKEGSNSEAYGGKGLLRKAIIFSVYPKEASTRCWYGNVVTNFKSYDDALNTAYALTEKGITDASLKASGADMVRFTKLQMLSSGAACLSSSYVPALGGTVCFAAAVNIWKKWGNKDGQEKAANGKTEFSDGQTITELSFDEVKGLIDTVENVPKGNGPTCPSIQALNLDKLSQSPTTSRSFGTGCKIFYGRATLHTSSGGKSIGDNSTRLAVYVHKVEDGKIHLTSKGGSSNCSSGYITTTEGGDDFDHTPTLVEKDSCNKQCD